MPGFPSYDLLVVIVKILNEILVQDLVTNNWLGHNELAGESFAEDDSPDSYMYSLSSYSSGVQKLCRPACGFDKDLDYPTMQHDHMPSTTRR